MEMRAAELEAALKRKYERGAQAQKAPFLAMQKAKHSGQCTAWLPLTVLVRI